MRLVLLFCLGFSQFTMAEEEVSASMPAPVAVSEKTEAGTCLDCIATSAPEKPSVLPDYADSSFGSCAQNANEALTPNPWYKFFSKEKPYQQLQDAWSEYNKQMNLRVGANAQLLDKELHFSRSPVVFLAGLERLNPMMTALDELNRDGILDKLKKYSLFKAASGTDTFMTAIRDYNFSSPDSKLVQSLQITNSPRALAAMKTIQSTLKDKDNFRVMQIMVRNNLSIIDNVSRKNAEALKAFMNARQVDFELIKTWDKDHPPLMKDIPYPEKLSGPFVDSYKSYVQADVRDFLMNHKLKLGQDAGQPEDPEVDLDLAAIKSVSPDISAEGIRNVNRATTPTNGAKVAYDDWIHPLHQSDQPSNINVGGKLMPASPEQLEAIDAVARTIWGEGQSCASAGLPQFEAIGHVICERAQDVKTAFVEEQSVTIKNALAVKDFNLHMFSSDADSQGQLATRMASTHLMGYKDFGRTDTNGSQLDPNIQVISRPMQFSIWNSSRYQDVDLSNLSTNHSANIPNVTVEVQKPQGEGDDNALLSAVCPEKTQYPKLWNHALTLAKQIVMDPQTYLDKYRFNSPTPNILFYTHAYNLPFAKEVFVDSLIMPPNNKPVPLREHPPGKIVPGSCGQFRLFTPDNQGHY